MPIIKNQISGHAGIVDTANSSYSLNAFAANSSETITGVAITNIAWSGDWKISEGNTVVWQTYANTVGQVDFAALGLSLNQNINCSSTGNLTLTTLGTQSSIALRVSKYGYNTAGI